eukprot:7967961-Alexandrium_andersonii.AAC.1
MAQNPANRYDARGILCSTSLCSSPIRAAATPSAWPDSPQHLAPGWHLWLAVGTAHAGRGQQPPQQGVE